MKTIGDDITSLLSAAKHSALIVAPFMRSEALSRLLESIPVGVETTVVARWRPADLLAGASDLDIYDIAESKNVALYLRHDLHAKYFAADGMCLIGSANVTLTALGWRTPNNFELLTPVDRTSDHIVEFEETLFSRAIRVTAKQRDRLQRLLEDLRRSCMSIPKIQDDTVGLLPSDWFPILRNPEELYSVYQGSGDVSHTALQSMQDELAQIGTIPGMNENEFREWIAATISQTALVGWVIQHIEQHGQVTEVVLANFLTQIGIDPKKNKTREVLEILERWLTYFLGTQYETVRDSVKLIKAKNI